MLVERGSETMTSYSKRRHCSFGRPWNSHTLISTNSMENIWLQVKLYQ